MDTYLLEFRLKPEALKQNKEDILEALAKLVKKAFSGSELLCKDFSFGITALFLGKSGNSFVLRMKDDFLAVDVSTFVADDLKVKNKVAEFERSVREWEFYQKPRTKEYLTLPAVKRGRSFSHYDCISHFLVERDFEDVVFDEVSPYQHVRIMHSPQYGNCLFLDNDLNLAESDLEYTKAITGFDQEDYEGKTVLILGGGDGGILHYLRDRGPSMITMIDIDQMVIDAAKIHLRGICHDALDNLSGKNYKVIVDDCVKYLEKYKQEGKKFDYVINDLTAIPVSMEPVGSHWDFLRLILSLSMKVLEDDGKYITQGNSQLQQEALKMYEKQLKMLECSVKFEKRVVCVPSYLENWIFYKIWKE